MDRKWKILFVLWAAKKYFWGTRKEEKKGRVQLPFRPYVKHYEKDFFLAKNAQNSPKKRKNTQKRSVCLRSFFVYPNGDLIGNRTRVYAVRGRRLNRLTIRPGLNCLCSISYFSFQGNCFYPSKRNFFCFSEKIFFFHPNVFFDKKRLKALVLRCLLNKQNNKSACAAFRIKANPLSAGGCGIWTLRTFRINTDLAYRPEYTLPIY